MKALNRRKKKHPIFKKIFWPMLFLTIIQAAVFYIATVYGGLMTSLNTNAEDILTERVINRSNEIATQFNTSWTNFSLVDEQLDSLYALEATENGIPIYNDSSAQRKMLSDSSDILINMLRKNEVNGVFLILNNSENEKDFSSEDSYYGLCIRDYDVKSAYTDREDLMLTRCPVSIASDIDCPLDTGWTAMYTFADSNSGAFFYNPLHQAYINPGIDADNLAYFSSPHNYDPTDRKVVSYSLPLIDDTGYPYGVLGIELTTNYLESLLPSSELEGQNSGFYALVQYDEGSPDFNIIAKNGTLYQRALGNTTKFTVDSSDNEFIKLSGKKDIDLVGSIQNLKIYNKNTPFENEHLALIGFEEESTLYSMTTSMLGLIGIATLVSLIIAIVGTVFTIRMITRPVQRLAGKVRSYNLRGASDNEIKLEKINLDEVDELVTALEDMSENIAKNQVRTEFFSRMSHDMRTPMNAIIGFSSPEILNNATEAEKDDYLEKIQNSGTYLLGLINEVLDMTKIESNKMELHEDIIPITSFIDETLPIINQVAKEKGVDLSVNFHTDKIYIYADRNRINQVLVNLLSNAVKFTPEGGTVSFSIEQLTRSSKTITNRITVEDSGIGMSKEFLRDLYQPFVQEHEGVVEGSGLGLSIAKKIIELMNGTIECESEIGKGTKFTVIITNKIADKPMIYEKNILTDNNDKIDSGSDALTGKRILICEDQPINFQIAKRILEKRGMIIDNAVNGLDGLEKFNNSSLNYYSAILMDVRMPKMDGIEATKSIRALTRPDSATIPIIAMTANAFADDVKETLVAGMNAHLSKPIEPQKLYETLEKYV